MNSALDKLATFNANQKLIEAVRYYKSCMGMSKNKVAQYEKIFMKMNADGTEGDLTRDEMLKAKEFFQIGEDADLMTDEDIVQFINFADINGDGFISLNEFVNGAIKYEEVLAEEQLQEAFETFDKDKDGVISAPDMIDVLSFIPSFDPASAQKIIDKYDVNGDGQMDFDEFKTFVIEDKQFEFDDISQDQLANEG